MKYLNKSFSVTMPRDTRGCCEACVFGRGEHANWCEHWGPDPVHFEQGRWWFWDETWAMKCGPWLTRAQAIEAVKAYAVWLDNGDKTAFVEALKQRADDAGVEVLRPAVGTAAEPAVSGEGKDKSCMSAVRSNVAPAGEEWKITGNAALDERID